VIKDIIQFNPRTRRLQGREPITAHIGFFGLCTEITAKLSYPGESVKFEPIEPRAQACVDQLRNKAKAPGRQEADVVVALTHVSLNEDKVRKREELEGSNMLPSRCFRICIGYNCGAPMGIG
jgi:2',3'-cyclic-nucleotide 2'-phosphodiesterase (5'-nucleotidase family)